MLFRHQRLFSTIPKRRWRLWHPGQLACSRASFGVGSFPQSRLYNTSSPPQYSLTSPFKSFSVVVAIGGGFGGWWLSSGFDQNVHLNMVGHSNFPTFPYTMPMLICSNTFSSWMIASSVSQLAHVEAQVRASYRIGASVIWPVARAGGAVGVRSFCMQVLFFGIQGLTAVFCLAGFNLGFANPLVAMSMLAMSIGPVMLFLPFGFFIGILMWSFGLAAGTVAGVQLSHGIATPGIGLERAIASLCGAARIDSALVKFHMLCGRVLLWSPVLTFTAMYLMYPSMAEYFVEDSFYHQSASNPDFISKRSKFRDVSE